MREIVKSLRVYILWVTAISVTAGAILAVMNAAGIMEPYWLATRGFTRTAVSTLERDTSARLLALEITAREASRDLTRSQLDRLEIELDKSGANEGIKQILNEQIGRYKVQLQSADDDLKRLRKQQAYQ